MYVSIQWVGNVNKNYLKMMGTFYTDERKNFHKTRMAFNVLQISSCWAKKIVQCSSSKHKFKIRLNQLAKTVPKFRHFVIRHLVKTGSEVI